MLQWDHEFLSHNQEIFHPPADNTGSWLDFILPVSLLCLFALFLYVNKRHQVTPADWVDQSKVLMREMQYEDSLYYTMLLVEAFPKNHIYVDQAATLYSYLRKYKEEAEMLEKFLLVAVDPSEACPRLPRAYRALQDDAKMVDAAERCLAIESTNSDFLFEAAISYERTGQKDKAFKIYQERKDQFKNYTDFAIGYARILLSQGQAQSAWTEMQSILKRKPNLADAQIVAANAAIELGKLREAREILEKAIEQHPSYLELYSAFVRIAIQEKNKEEIKSLINAALDVAPDDSDFLKLKVQYMGNE